MRWKKISNFIVALILSIAYTIVTILNLIGPLHTNSTGLINKPGPLFWTSIIYWIFSLSITWGLYFFLKNKPRVLFFILIVLGIGLIIFENFIWAGMGSQY